MSAPARDQTMGGDRSLHAYHDGELRGLARWRFERRLRRTPALRRELEALDLMGNLARELDARMPTPDFWDAIEMRLPALDAARREDEGQVPGIAATLGWLVKPIGAIAAAAAVAGAIFVGMPGAAPVTGGVVRWVDSGDRNVMVLEEATGTTIIWVLDSASDAAGRGVTSAVI